jgi:hypothetical protein
MQLVSSFTIGPPQADGRSYVREVHVAPDGLAYDYEWLHDGTHDPQMILEQRAAAIGAE